MCTLEAIKNLLGKEYTLKKTQTLYSPEQKSFILKPENSRFSGELVDTLEMTFSYTPEEMEKYQEDQEKLKNLLGNKTYLLDGVNPMVTKYKEIKPEYQEEYQERLRLNNQKLEEFKKEVETLAQKYGLVRTQPECECISCGYKPRDTVRDHWYQNKTAHTNAYLTITLFEDHCEDSCEEEKRTWWFW